MLIKNKIFDLIQTNKKQYSLYLYDPIVLNGELIFDSKKREYKNQFKRINPISNNISENSSCLDLGCNTGFILQELIRLKNIVATGVDNISLLIDLCKKISIIENNNSIFIECDINKYIYRCKENNIKYDNVLLTSVWNFEQIIKKIDSILEITNNKLFIEPTNHSHLSPVKLYKKYKLYFENKYNYKLLAITDYQNRLLFMIEK